MSQYHTLFDPPVPSTPGSKACWGRLYGAADAPAITAAAQRYSGPLLVITPDMQEAERLEAQTRFFSDEELPVLSFPDWETLPYDAFSPHQDIVSRRLETLSRLPDADRGVLIVPVPTLMQRLPPQSYLDRVTFLLDIGDQLDIEALRGRLEAAGYRCVAQVMERGEFAVRGSLMDIYPMGAELPYRVDLFDNEVDTIRTFNPDDQRSIEKVNGIRLLPAREFPLDEAGINQFRQAYRATFEGDPQSSELYRDVSHGLAPGGIEYYLPLFFQDTATIFDYLPDNTLLVSLEGAERSAETFLSQVESRYEQRRHNLDRPLLPPDTLYLSTETLETYLSGFPWISIQHLERHADDEHCDLIANFATSAFPDLRLRPRVSEPAAHLLEFINTFSGRVLFVAESAGRREALYEMLADYGIRPRVINGWQAFLDSEVTVGLTVAPLDQGVLAQEPSIALITESQLFGERALQSRRRSAPTRDAESVVKDLTDLHIGAAVVHEEHGVGRYQGLQKFQIGGCDTEFLTLEYAGGDKLYVPVSSLHLISRYTGAGPDNAPLHRLGSGHWQRTKRKAAERARDVAAELLDIYARRQAQKGTGLQLDTDSYNAFAAAFPFEETPDQQQAIEAVMEDLQSNQPMDRVICGDVGFGKTEVAMRAAFTAVQAGRQVAVLVPTTVLAQQHYQNFLDRFADWPVRIESLSRFRSKKEQNQIIEALNKGTLDIVIGTHKLLGSEVKFKNLGLVIVDEEHRFGVRQKERLKALRAEVDVLTMTATPIPRTLNMSLSGLRDLSLITTAPANRLAIKTFVSRWDQNLIQEALLRELKRGGQVYYLHNDVDTIYRTAKQVEEMVPEASVGVAHGQMRERELEQMMLDFYHRRFNVLVCTTIIESGIDVPNANTIIIERADKLGLAQLHQLRGRVGRSHHRAYAYLITPPPKAMTPDAVKRLEAIESLEDLGAGFTLATHDLEIRGAGELLGEGQSGQIQEIGFTLYNELLERAVKAMKAGHEPELDNPLDHGPEIDLQVAALIPEDYLPDIHSRLVMYKRIASAESHDALRELQVEMIDRFGMLPPPVKNLFEVTRLKLSASPLGITKIEAGPTGGRILFGSQPLVNPGEIAALVQRDPETYRLDGQDRLRFFMELPDTDARVEAVQRLLDTIALREAA